MMTSKKFILTLLFVVITLFVLNKDVFADDYPVTCDLFEVSRINDDGSLSKVSCHSSFSEASKKMKENEDYVVRNKKSLSPTKIVDMNSGIAYTYPYRANSLTQTVYSDLTDKLNGTGASTYLTIHYPLTYISNRNYNEIFGYSGGWAHVLCHGFDGYVDLEYVDLVPTKYLKKGIAIKLGGHDKTSRNEQPFKVICKPNTYEAKRNGNYTDLVFTFYRGWSSDTNGGVGLKASTSIGVAPDFMVEGTKYYSDDGINFYSDIKLTKLVGTYYNYYQFVPFRTKSNISGAKLSSYINDNVSKPNTSQLYNRGNEFKDNETKYGCNATLVFAMAIHESGWGKSTLSYDPYNNLFGYGAYDSDVSMAHKYPTISDCVASQMADNLANYMDVQCSTYFSMSLGNKGGGFVTKYASDPYWAEKIAHYYYDIDKYANNYNGNLSDYNSYNLALVNSYNAEVKKSAKSSSSTLYKTANKKGYQKNLIVATLGNEGNFTKTQLSNPLNDSGQVIYPITLAAGTLVKYDFNKCVGYIASSALTPINSSIIPPEEKEEDVKKDPKPDLMNPMVAIDELTIDGNILKISGMGTITYSNLDDLSKIKHEFVIKNLETGNEASFELTSKEYEGFGLNDGYDYTYSGFSGSVDLTEIINGVFKLSIRITNDKYVKEKNIINTDIAYHNMVSIVGDTTYKINSNERYGYRLELEIFESPLDYSLINIPKNRISLFSFDNFTIDDNLNLHIDGQAMIYYTNYTKAEDVTYKVYLIKDKDNYKELETNRITCSLNYNDFVDSKYDRTNICFEANGSVKDLDGIYNMVIEIDKKDGKKTYIDYVEMHNLGDLKLPSIVKDDKVYEALKTSVRERMILKVSDNEK